MAARRRKTAKTRGGAVARRLAAVPRLSQALARLEKQLPKELRAPLSTWRRQVATWEARLDRLREDRDARFAQLPTTDPSFHAAGTEPLYSFGANVIQMFVSVWF